MKDTWRYLSHEIYGSPESFWFGALTALAFAAIMAAYPFQTKPLTATTSEPELLESGKGSLLPAWTEEEYQKRVAPMMKARNFLPMTRKPAELSPQARFGLALGIENDSRILSWVLDGDEKKATGSLPISMSTAI